DLLSVGARNTEAVKNKLSELGIPLVASDTGENYGRTIEFTAGQDKLLVKAVGKPEKYI
ncbi:MAG TPA: chemotaxis protein CheD, partial [Eubacterium sp.]|nr:chemotaxis protein CheD [Eubacterium sp.]